MIIAYVHGKAWYYIDIKPLESLSQAIFSIQFWIFISHVYCVEYLQTSYNKWCKWHFFLISLKPKAITAIAIRSDEGVNEAST